MQRTQHCAQRIAKVGYFYCWAKVRCRPYFYHDFSDCECDLSVEMTLTPFAFESTLSIIYNAVNDHETMGILSWPS